MSDAYEQVEVTSVAELRQWLEVEHDRRDGAWLVTWKKNTPDKYVSYEELVRELLCVGWIDSQARRLDENRSQLMITPRRPGSAWSQPNKIRVAELQEAGLMRPAGLAAVALAQQTGTWTALDDVDNLVEPAALAEALDANPSRPAALGGVSAIGPAGHSAVDQSGQTGADAGDAHRRDGAAGRGQHPGQPAGATRLIGGLPTAPRRG